MRHPYFSREPNTFSIQHFRIFLTRFYQFFQRDNKSNFPPGKATIKRLGPSDWLKSTANAFPFNCSSKPNYKVASMKIVFFIFFFHFADLNGRIINPIVLNSRSKINFALTAHNRNGSVPILRFPHLFAGRRGYEGLLRGLRCFGVFYLFLLLLNFFWYKKRRARLVHIGSRTKWNFFV